MTDMINECERIGIERLTQCDAAKLGGEYYYITFFGKYPSKFGIGSHDIATGNDDVVDVKLCDNKLLHKLYGDNIKVIQVMGKSNNLKMDAYTYGDAFIMGEYVFNETIVIMMDKKVVLSFNDSGAMLYYSMDDDIDAEKLLIELVKKLPLKTDDEETRPSIKLMTPTSNGYTTVTSEINDVDINLKENYNDDFEKVAAKIDDFLNAEERVSGLILLNGKPGTGKTYYLRHVITHHKNKDFIIIPPAVAANMDSPEFTMFMTANTDSIFILEDCEQIIKDRKQNIYSSAISSILNMSDGLMSDVFNGKFICTFNADLSTIDEAVLRKGRCVTHYTFDKLEQSKATKLLHKLGFKTNAKEDMTLADIYNYSEDEKKRKKGKKKSDSLGKIGFDLV